MGSTTTADVEVRPGPADDVIIEAVSDTGFEFVDAYTPKNGQELEVVDSGWIRLSGKDAEEDFLAAAKERGLTIERSE